jgi:hypothetical protein
VTATTFLAITTMQSDPVGRSAPDAAHFAAALCRNCDAPLPAGYCAACGQPRARRLDLRAVGSEAWLNWRLFEWELARAAWRLATRPGLVAREYVMGARKRHVHPLKLLLFAIGLLLIVLTRVNYLDSDRAGANQTIELLRAWSNWSFSLGIIAILAASQLVFRRRGGYNATEHLVLAVYCQFLVICASLVSKLPTLLWRDAAFIAMHKAASGWFIDGVGALVLGLAFTQFFGLDLRRDALRLLASIAIHLALKWLLVRAYLWLLVLSLFGTGP